MYSSIIIITYSPSTVQVTVFLKENVSARRGRDQLSCLGIEGQHLPSADYYITQGHVRSTHKSLPSKEASLPTPRPANLFHPARVSWCGDASNPTCQEGRSSSRSDSQLSLCSPESRAARHGSIILKATRKQVMFLAQRHLISPQIGKQNLRRIQGNSGRLNTGEDVWAHIRLIGCLFQS